MATSFARFLVQLGEFPKLGELLVLSGAEVAHALLTVGSLAFGVRSFGITVAKCSRSELSSF